MFGRRGHDRPAPGDPLGGWCASCGAAFAIGARQCPDCGTELSHEPPRPAEEDPEPRHDVVEYDLSDWDAARLTELNRQLGAVQIPHTWDEERRLHVPGVREADVDEMIDAIDGLDGDAPAVEYELPEWTLEACDELVRRLQDAGLSFDWDGCVLTVDPSLEATVDRVVRAIDPTFPSQVTGG